MNGATQILKQVKTTVTLVVAFLVFDALFEAMGTSTFFGVNFSIIPWIILIFAVISALSDLGLIKWIEKMFRKFQ